MTSSWKLSPSDLTFLWDECPRCFYLKVVLGFNRPAAPFPKIFNRIDKLMKDFFTGKSTSELSLDLPPGMVRFAERWVQSQPISLPNHAHSCYIRGKFDSLVEFNDRTFGVVDFKTSEAKPEHIKFYSRQLHAYAYALEHASPGSLSIAPISKLGLFCVEPIGMERVASGQVAYLGNVAWLEVPKSEASFIEFLDRVLSVLEQAAPPEKGVDCAYCDYRAAARKENL
jgi:CRISPR/Cas system-associated exonuclease Cas4 (RecB family)